MRSHVRLLYCVFLTRGWTRLALNKTDCFLSCRWQHMISESPRRSQKGSSSTYTNLLYKTSRFHSVSVLCKECKHHVLQFFSVVQLIYNVVLVSGVEQIGSVTHAMSMLSFQSCLILCDPMDCSPRAPLSQGLSRQEYWSRLPCPPPGHLPNPGTEHRD